MTPGKLFKNHSGKAQADFGRRSVAVYMRFSKSVHQRSQNGIFNSFPLQVMKMSWELFKIHCGKASADFEGRSVAVYMSFSKLVQQRSQNGIFNSSPLPGATC